MCRDIIRVKDITETIRNSQKVALECCLKYRVVEKVIRKDCYESSGSIIHTTRNSISTGKKLNRNAGENGDNVE